MRLAALAAALCVALLGAGCGGGSGSSSSTAPPAGGADGAGGAPPPKEGGRPKKATAPNAPAGSRVVACEEGAADAEGLRATAVDCASAREAMRQWGRSRACALAEGASRSSCALGGFRCQAIRSGRRAAVSCARRGGDVAFVAKAWPLKRSPSR